MNSTYIKYVFGLLVWPLSMAVFAQENENQSDLEEVVVIG